MRAFNIGFIATLSFLLAVSVMFLTLGFYPAPTGPAYPVYPENSDTSYNSDGTYTEKYNREMEKYNDQLDDYDKESENFTKDKFVPYIQSVFIGWIVILVLFEILAILLTKNISPVIGGAYAFTGIWAIFVGPLMSWMLIAMFGLSSMSGNKDTAEMFESMYRMIGIAGALGSTVLTVVGLKLLSPAKETK